MHSRFMTVDVFATFLCAATLYGALRLLPKNADDPPPNYWKWALWGAAFAGLAAGTKYNAVVVLIAPIVALVWVRPTRWPAMLAAAVFVAAVAFFVATPGAITNSEKFMTDLTYELNHSRTGHGLVFEGAGSSIALHAVNLIVGVGLLATGLGFAGLIWGSARKHAPIAVVGSFALLYLLVLSRAEIAFLRYTFPLIPCLGFGVGWLVSLVKGIPKWDRAAIAVAILAIGGLPLGDGLYASGRIVAAMAGMDSRDAIARYFLTMPVDKPMSIGVVEDTWFYTPPFYPEANAPRFVSVEARDDAMRSLSSPRIVRHIGPNGERSDWDIGLLESDRPLYVVYSSFESGDLERLSRTPNLRPEIQAQVDAYVTFKKRLEADYVLQVVLSGLGTTVHDMEYVRPTLWVWKRKPIP